MKLIEKKCVPCEGGVPPFKGEEIQEYLGQLQGEWEVENEKKIKYKFEFPGFKEAIEFVNRVANLAEKENHHPNIRIYYNKVVIELTTHSIGGLSENDFILAAKIEQLN
ncbi:4a-hydroxytetrahydrobiopterin dehydratase [Patescibacteria group bacterium]|nr:4a-hydroxytetrahydrobiopterin dehydratase [Patescibacteria group bacterium]